MIDKIIKHNHLIVINISTIVVKKLINNYFINKIFPTTVVGTNNIII